MRIVLIFFLLVSTTVFSAEKVGEKDGFLYRNQKISTIDWRDINEQNWLDLSLWKKDRVWREKVGNWRLYYQEIKLVEPVGKLIECVGNCIVHRGEKREKFKPVFKSKIVERDEFSTGEKSYAYVYLLNGTLMRLSPNTSVSVNEFNINKSGSFVYIRVNFGQVLTIPRHNLDFTVRKESETDIIFYPLTFYQAHMNVMDKDRFSEDELFKYTMLKKRYEKKYIWLNELINKHQTVEQQRTVILFSTSNGSLSTSNTITDVISMKNGDSFVRVRSGEGLYYDQSPEHIEAYFNIRENVNLENESLDLDKWYSITNKNNSFSYYPEGDKRFYMPSLITRRIPSILVARELFVERYSKYLLEKNLTKKLLATRYSFRLWDEWGTNGDSDKRLEFLKKYTQKVEYKNVREKAKLFARLSKRGEKVVIGNYNESYYADAVREYFFSQKKRASRFDLKTGVLNSTRKKFWRIVTKQYD